MIRYLVYIYRPYILIHSYNECPWNNILYYSQNTSVSQTLLVAPFLNSIHLVCSPLPESSLLHIHVQNAKYHRILPPYNHLDHCTFLQQSNVTEKRMVKMKLWLTASLAIFAHTDPQPLIAFFPIAMFSPFDSAHKVFDRLCVAHRNGLWPILRFLIHVLYIYLYIYSIIIIIIDTMVQVTLQSSNCSLLTSSTLWNLSPMFL